VQNWYQGDENGTRAGGSTTSEQAGQVRRRQRRRSLDPGGGPARRAPGSNPMSHHQGRTLGGRVLLRGAHKGWHQAEHRHQDIHIGKNTPSPSSQGISAAMASRNTYRGRLRIPPRERTARASPRQCDSDADRRQWRRQPRPTSHDSRIRRHSPWSTRPPFEIGEDQTILQPARHRHRRMPCR